MSPEFGAVAEPAGVWLYAVFSVAAGLEKELEVKDGAELLPVMVITAVAVPDASG